MFDLQTFGQRIRRERRSRDWTQAQLADMAQMSTKTIRHVERGLHSTTLANLVALSDVFGISTDELLGRSGNGHRHSGES